jgi:hypothetical protein
MKIKFVSLSVLICIVVSGFCQTDFDNHKKYWYYRSRLNNDFLKIGLDSGESIPFSERGAKSPS